MQQEGEVLARKNGELEATTRKLRVQLKEADSERERLNKRLSQQNDLLTTERDRLERKLADSAKQVPLSGLPLLSPELIAWLQNSLMGSLQSEKLSKQVDAANAYCEQIYPRKRTAQEGFQTLIRISMFWSFDRG